MVGDRASADAPWGSRSQLETYFREVNRTPLLSADEERCLGERAQAGDLGARNHLVRANLRLAIKIAKQFAGRGLSLPDLIQEANLGLLRAADKFDPSLNTRFSTYASFWILQSLRRALMHMVRPIRLPGYVVDLLSKWEQAGARLSDDLGRTPTFDEVTQAMQLSARRTEILRQALLVSSTSFVDEEAWVGGAESLADDQDRSPESVLIRREVLEYVHQLIETMEPMEKRVLRMRFGLDGNSPRTRKSIAESLKLEEHQVRQIEKTVLARLAAQWLSREAPAGRESGSVPVRRVGRAVAATHS